MEHDENFKRLIQELGHAINDSLAESPGISEVMGRIREAGYDLFLVLEVTIGFNKRGEFGVTHRQKLTTDPAATRTEFQLTSEDARFLRALKINIEKDTE